LRSDHPAALAMVDSPQFANAIQEHNVSAISLVADCAG
jgi:hypothetical protein